MVRAFRWRGLRDWSLNVNARLEVGAVGQRRRALVWRVLLLLAVTAGLWIASRSTAPRLTTQNELNTVSVAGALESVVKIAARSPPELVAPGQSPSETGSGFFVARGLIVTNAHVISGAVTLRVTLRDGRELPAVVVGVDGGYDLALLRVSTNEIAPLEFATTNQSGQKVIVLGEPLGYRNFVAVGTLSSVSYVAQDNADGIGSELPQLMLTDAQVLPGNSGGPALDSSGRVLGVVAAQFRSNSSGERAYGLAIPYWLAQTAIRDLEQFGRPRRASLGVRLLDAADLSPLTLETLKLDSARGALILSVEPESVAERAGLRGSDTDESGRLSQLGDVIVELNAVPIRGQESLLQALSRVRIGQTVTLTILRRGKLLPLRVTL